MSEPLPPSHTNRSSPWDSYIGHFSTYTEISFLYAACMFVAMQAFTVHTISTIVTYTSFFQASNLEPYCGDCPVITLTLLFGNHCRLGATPMVIFNSFDMLIKFLPHPSKRHFMCTEPHSCLCPYRGGEALSCLDRHVEAMTSYGLQIFTSIGVLQLHRILDQTMDRGNYTQFSASIENMIMDFTSNFCWIIEFCYPQYTIWHFR